MPQRILGVAAALEAKLALEVVADALHVAVKVPLGVAVVGGCHLRKVDERQLARVGAHQVELVEVAVDEPVRGELDNEVHASLVELGMGIR